MFLEGDIIIRITSSPHAHSKTQQDTYTQRQSQRHSLYKLPNRFYNLETKKIFARGSVKKGCSI